ncbi:MAG TPA: hypothetical protein VMX16_15470 [Terriglobia bacterium]|nr:hypothetical protein [Terriglobia bacterium]
MSNSENSNKTNKTDFFGVYSGPPFEMELRGLNMRLINVFSFYELGAALGKLRIVGWLERKDAFEALFDAERQLKKLKEHGKEFFEPLNHTASGISVDIDEATRHLETSDHIGEDNERLLNKSLDEFEHAFAHEGFYQRVFGVEQLRAYMMPILVDGADEAFSAAVVKLLPEGVTRDIKEAGRALAFELPTAAGIHTMRAFEKVLKQFYKHASGKEPGTRDIYTLIDELRRESLAESKTLAVVDQIRHVHRNPLVHEVFIDIDEAVDLFDIAKSAITAMVLESRAKLLAP